MKFIGVSKKLLKVAFGFWRRKTSSRGKSTGEGVTRQFSGPGLKNPRAALPCLPPELLIEVGTHLPAKDLNNLMRTCLSFNNLLKGQLQRIAMTDGGRWALRWAAEHNNTTVTRVLIDQYGANVDVRRDQHDFTPLHLAAYHGHVQIAEYLLQRGADINASATYIDPLPQRNRKYMLTGARPLAIALRLRRTNMARLLIDKPALNIDVRFEFRQGNSIQAPGPLVGADITFAHWAALSCYPEALAILNQRGADLDAVDSAGNTPAQFVVAAQNSLNAKGATLKYLAHAGCDLNARNNAGLSPILHSMAFYPADETLQVLLDMGYRTNDRGASLRRVLRRNVNEVETAKILAPYDGLEYNNSYPNRMTMLHYAVFWGDQEFLLRLLDLGHQMAQRHITWRQIRYWMDPLCLAAVLGHKNMMAPLMQHVQNFELSLNQIPSQPEFKKAEKRLINAANATVLKGMPEDAWKDYDHRM